MEAEGAVGYGEIQMSNSNKPTADELRDFYGITLESIIYQRGDFFFKKIDGKEVQVERPKGLKDDRTT